MADTGHTDPQTAPTEPAKAPKFEGEFDPERAARLVENLRKEIEDLKADKSALARELQQREDAEKSDAEKTADRLKAAEEAARKAQRDLYVERAARTHSLPDDLVEFLTGETEEEIAAKAERLAKFGSAKTEDPNPADDEQAPAGVPQHRPEPSLTPGHGGAATEPFDPKAVAQAARA